MSKYLWTEHYRPKSVSEYVFSNQDQKSKVLSWIQNGSIGHTLLSGSAGVGKTTLARLLLNELGVDWGDVMFINASITNSVDDVRDRILNFCTTVSFGEFKYVILDEGDYLSPNAQAALRGVMEQFSNTCRFIITCNYPNRIIPAIHSRSNRIEIEKLDHTEFTARVAQILIEENVEFDLEVLDLYVRASYPDMRKCINLLQESSTTGTLLPVDQNNSTTNDFRVNMIALFRSGDLASARKLICQQATPEEYDGIFRFLYENLDVWSQNYEQQCQALLIIRNGMVNDTLVADREINLSATLAELELLQA